MAVTLGSVSLEVSLQADGFLAPEPSLGQAQSAESPVWDSVAAKFTADIQVRPPASESLEFVADLAYGDFATLAGYQDGTPRTLAGYPLASGAADIPDMLLVGVGQPAVYLDSGGSYHAVAALRFIRPK